MRLRDDCFRGSALRVSIRSPSFGCHLSQPTMAALLKLSDVIMQLAPAAPAAAGSALQTAVLLDCSLDCQLVPDGGREALAVVTAGVQCFACSNVAGRQGASVLLVAADAVKVAADEESVLAGTSGHASPALDVTRLSRQGWGRAGLL